MAKYAITEPYIECPCCYLRFSFRERLQTNILTPRGAKMSDSMLLDALADITIHKFNCPKCLAMYTQLYVTDDQRYEVEWSRPRRLPDDLGRWTSVMIQNG